MNRWMAAVVCVAALGTPSLGESQPGPVALYLAFNDESSCIGDPTPECQVARLLSATVDGADSRVNWLREIPPVPFIQYGYVTPDGRHIVWLGGSSTAGTRVFVHDILSGVTAALPFSGASYLFGNPARPEVYLAGNDGVTAVGPSGTRSIALPCTPFGLPTQLPGVSSDGSRASIPCAQGPNGATTVFETSTGAIVTTQPGIGVISAAGDALYLVDYVNDTYRLQRRTLSGQVLADVPHRGNGGLKVDRATGDVVAYFRAAAPNVVALDGTSLATKSATTVRMSIYGNHPEPMVHDAGGLVASFSEGVDVADLRTGQLVVRALMHASPLAAVVFGPPVPAPPSTLTAMVQNRTVSLQWSPPAVPASVTRHVLEVGSAPGMSDIFSGLDLGLQTTFSASGVPPGRYYVRVRAGNYSGLSAPSNEVVVEVP